MPHTGCEKFAARFGLDAMKFVNSEVGKELCLRGINAKVVQEGTIRVGDTAKNSGESVRVQPRREQVKKRTSKEGAVYPRSLSPGLLELTEERG